MKFGLKYYFKPTPVSVQKKADAMTMATTALAGYSVVNGSMVMLASVFALSQILKFISECFYDDNI